MISKQMRRKPAETCSSASPLYANSLPAGMRRTCSPKTMGVKRRIWTFGYAGSRNGTSLNSKIILALFKKTSGRSGYLNNGRVKKKGSGRSDDMSNMSQHDCDMYLTTQSCMPSDRLTGTMLLQIAKVRASGELSRKHAP